eukprot:Transcript_8014.p1 GENE.Transcript_8014~~Transcript_8014.p1  ORF type:complete len:414 (+),score=86.23 Transcript_8014:218-1459(+)
MPRSTRAGDAQLASGLCAHAGGQQRQSSAGSLRNPCEQQRDEQQPSSSSLQTAPAHLAAARPSGCAAAQRRRPILATSKAQRVGQARSRRDRRGQQRGGARQPPEAEAMGRRPRAVLVQRRPGDGTAARGAPVLQRHGALPPAPRGRVGGAAHAPRQPRRGGGGVRDGAACPQGSGGCRGGGARLALGRGGRGAASPHRRRARDGGDGARPLAARRLRRQARHRLAVGRVRLPAVRDSRWAAVDAALPLRIVGELETAATVLARSPLVDSDGRRDIGWQWGACGYRRCGAQADAAQALCKLRANLGMIVPVEALFYLDVAKRAIDEIVSVGANAGLGRGAALPRRTPDAYLPPETLDTILVDELLSPLEQPVYKQRPGEGGDGSDEVEAALAAYEASMMEYLEKEMGKGASND